MNLSEKLLHNAIDHTWACLDANMYEELYERSFGNLIYYEIQRNTWLVINRDRSREECIEQKLKSYEFGE